MKARFHFDLIIMIVCSVFLVALILLGGGCCKNPSNSEEPDTVTDIDGHVYQTVQIGNQLWMAENLKVTHYRNGDAIPNVMDSTEWSNWTTGAYCDYKNEAGNSEEYGRLYNWLAVDDSRGIAPEGWHVPTDEEWKRLEMHVGMSRSDADGLGRRGTAEGGKLKEAGDEHWKYWNENSTNEFGFTALPGGYRNIKSVFSSLGNYGCFWSSSRSSDYNAWYRKLTSSDIQVYREYRSKRSAYSVRCVWDG